jgi:metallo-beta-lactamase class B
MRRLFSALVLFVTLHAAAQIKPEWTTPLAPFKIADNLYYVGSQDLAAYLITTPAGNILINANLETSPPQIRRSIEQLGFRYADTKILLNGQGHFDHMAGAAQILRETHAQNMVMDGDAPIVESGGRSDPLFASASFTTSPPSPSATHPTAASPSPPTAPPATLAAAPPGPSASIFPATRPRSYVMS